MATTGKKIEVRLGAFACSIEGYDNPVEQMREVLSMVQQMVAETPQLAAQAGSFDAAEVESALDAQGTDAEVQPGLVVMRADEHAQGPTDVAPEAPKNDGKIDVSGIGSLASVVDITDVAPSQEPLVVDSEEASDDPSDPGEPESGETSDGVEDEAADETSEASEPEAVVAAEDGDAAEALDNAEDLENPSDIQISDPEEETTEAEAEPIEFEAADTDEADPDIAAMYADAAGPAEEDETPADADADTDDIQDAVLHGFTPDQNITDFNMPEVADAGTSAPTDPENFDTDHVIDEITIEALPPVEEISETPADDAGEQAEVIHLRAPEAAVEVDADADPVEENTDLSPDQAIRQAVLDQIAEVEDTAPEATAFQGDEPPAQETASPDTTASDAPWERDALKAALAAGAVAAGAAVASEVGEDQSPDADKIGDGFNDAYAPESSDTSAAAAADADSASDAPVDLRDAIMSQIRGTGDTPPPWLSDAKEEVEAEDASEVTASPEPSIFEALSHESANDPTPEVETAAELAEDADFVEDVSVAEDAPEMDVAEDVEHSPFGSSLRSPLDGARDSATLAPIQAEPEPTVISDAAAAVAAEPAPSFNIFAAPAANATQAVSGAAQAVSSAAQAVQIDILPPDHVEEPVEVEDARPAPQNPSAFEKDAGFEEDADQTASSRPAFSMPVDEGRDEPVSDWRLDLMRRIKEDSPDADVDGMELTQTTGDARGSRGGADAPGDSAPVEAAATDDRPVNIFAQPGETQPAPAPIAEPQMEASQTAELQSRTETGGEADTPGRSRFDALLTRIQEGPKVSAPAEEAAPDLSPLDSDGAAISAVELANLSKADSVADLLAASAAWLTLVKGSNRFSRREVMQVFDDLPGDHPKTLEARIKGYGKLVRSGTLMLVDDGVFALAQPAKNQYKALMDRR